VGRGSSFRDSQSYFPTIILTNCGQDVVIIIFKEGRKEACTRFNVVIWVLTIPTRSTPAFILSNLHEALFPSTAHRMGITGRLLHCDRGNENWWNIELCSILLEQRDIWSTSFEGGSRLSDGLIQIGDDELVNSDWWRLPTTSIYTTV